MSALALILVKSEVTALRTRPVGVGHRGMMSDSDSKVLYLFSASAIIPLFLNRVWPLLPITQHSHDLISILAQSLWSNTSDKLISISNIFPCQEDSSFPVSYCIGGTANLFPAITGTLTRF